MDVISIIVISIQASTTLHPNRIAVTRTGFNVMYLLTDTHLTVCHPLLPRSANTSLTKTAHPATHLYSNPSTISPIASELVSPGLSMPSRFTHPSYPSSRRMTKSLNPVPSMTACRAASLGRMPA